LRAATMDLPSGEKASVRSVRNPGPRRDKASGRIRQRHLAAASRLKLAIS
jgi:hypothetical protein